MQFWVTQHIHYWEREHMNRFTWIALTGFVLWIAESWFFGWNKTPQSPLEQILDTISVVLMFWGIVGEMSGMSITSNEVQIKSILVCEACYEKNKKDGLLFKEPSGLLVPDKAIIR